MTDIAPRDSSFVFSQLPIGWLVLFSRENHGVMVDEGDCELGSALLPTEIGMTLVSALEWFHERYGLWHPYLSVVMCVGGTVLNLLTVVVFTRPTMVNPVNTLLCAIALCDAIVMLSYLIFVGHFLLVAASRCNPTDYSYGWAVFTMVHAHASVVFHSSSLWLTVALAHIRVVTVRRATNTTPCRWVTTRFAVLLSTLVLMAVTVTNIPNALTFQIVSDIPAALAFPCVMRGATPTNETIATVQVAGGDCTLLRLTFWSNGLLFKVIPCSLLTLFICLLARLIKDVRRRRRESLAISLTVQRAGRKPRTDHTSRMLLTVLIIFLSTELPQGVLLTLSGVLADREFHRKVYASLGDFMDLLSLVNSSVNFIIYCSMSRKFRQVFFGTFLFWTSDWANTNGLTEIFASRQAISMVSNDGRFLTALDGRRRSSAVTHDRFNDRRKSRRCTVVVSPPPPDERRTSLPAFCIYRQDNAQPPQTSVVIKVGVESTLV
uniref:G-protein coupled receptors family 1 profile domain-containing protein n=1 Tax=Plectus sambesii TaxID=2011161 RepID=A0A914UIT2_9BILA